MSDDGSERRTHVRTQVVLKVEYVDPHLVLADYLTDLGEGGMFVRTRHPFVPGDRLGFVVSFPGLVEPMELRGVVRWRRDPARETSEEPAGVGVELIFESDESRVSFLDLLHRVRAEKILEPMANGEQFRVLLVEDNDFVQDLFQHAIRKFNKSDVQADNLEVVTAKDGKEGWDALQREDFDLAIVDHFLPVMSGVELVGRLRRDERLKAMPVLMVSVGGDEVRSEALRAGADIYLDKPVLLRQLLDTLRKLVGTT